MSTLNTETLTKKLHAKADRELRAKLKATFDQIWKDCDEGRPTRPKLEDWPLLKAAVKGNETPWLGDVWKTFLELAFAYQAPAAREKAVNDFMAQVENMQEQIASLEQY